MKICSGIYALLVFGLVFVASPTTNAQFHDISDSINFGGLGLPQIGASLPGINGGLGGNSLVATPSYPEPFEQFSIELMAPSTKMAGAKITWYVDGEEQLTYRNSRTLELVAGDMGETMQIKATLTGSDGASDNLLLNIKPVQVDIVVEGNTIVPDFYKGRAVPSAGTTGRATAVLHTGASIDRQGLNYRWELNGNVLNGGSIRGLQTTEFDLPQNRQSFLKVIVSNSSKTLVERTVVINPVTPEIIFYEDNPLYGINQKALSNVVSIPGNQAVILAEPYYIAPFEDKPNYLVEWSVGGQTFNTANEAEPTKAVLTGSGSESVANVYLRMADLSTLSLPVSGSFVLRFGI